ncbi:AMMECR1-like protein [Phialemonium atrogriseum]|uniref:AMMECR1-like protein n=1 Tax=Phialemonium atrogriseum TaxID=1093897 RepID=A0AAJ0BYC0_9PEZI|nr:AMMECR1-like protein [Phialemonium atrogriseum]KAK1766531.1 AMMECR1-like protein [Phialemonium atrogriseum]
MATVEHCLYCFEALASHLEDRKSMTLTEVQESWAEYLKDTGDKAKKLAKRLPALQRLATDDSSSSSSSSSAASSGTCSPSTSSTLSLAQSGSGADTPATSISSLSVSPAALSEHPLFVTWNTVSSRHGNSLRGCIGTFEPQELEEGLSSYALTSALHDMRFNPVSARELPSLEVAVTLLTDFEDAADAMDWELGTHGLRLSFHYHGKRYGSTYLPDVASEQGWTKEETLVSLMRKAGWMGKRDSWKDVDLKVVRYQGKKENVEYAEYKAWRDWVKKQGVE